MSLELETVTIKLLLSSGQGKACNAAQKTKKTKNFCLWSSLIVAVIMTAIIMMTLIQRIQVHAIIIASGNYQ